MIVIKEVLIHDKKWHLELKTYSDRLGIYGNGRFQLHLYCIEDKSKSVLMFNNWMYIYVYKGPDPSAYIFNNMREAKIEILKYLLNENI